MVPVRLVLRNFLSYGEDVPPLDFTGIHIACLSGENGHGKSALLDAITWALWGSARACDNNRGADQLIRLGATEMEVELWFESGGRIYRVVRKRLKPSGVGRQGRPLLELQLDTPNGFIPLTGNTTQDTQRRINDILRMDYDTFINSAFLLQGRSNEFTTSPPAKRKEVLGRILGLETYDNLAERARELSRTRGRDADELARELQRIDRALERRPELEAQQAATQAELSEIEARLREQEGLLTTLRDALAAQEGQRRQLERARANLKQTEDELRRLSTEAESHRQRIAAHQALLAERDEIEGSYQRLLAAQAEESAMSERLQRVQVLERERERLERLIETERQDLLRQENLLAADVQRLRQQVAQMPAWSAELQSVQQALTDLRAEEEQAASFRERAQTARAEAQALQMAVQQLGSDLDELRLRLAAISHGDDTHCPLCGTDLGHAGIAEVERKLREEEATKTRQMAEHQQRAAALQGQAEQDEREALTLEREVTQRREAMTARRAMLETALADAQTASEALKQRDAELTVVRQRLTTEDYATDERAKLGHLVRQIASLGYDAARHTAMREEIAALRPYEERHRQLQTAVTLLERDQEGLANVERNRQTWLRQQEQAQAEVKDLEERIARQPDLESKVAAVQAERDRLAQTQSRYREMLGAIGQQLDELRRLAMERARSEAAYREAAQEKETYSELGAAFGKSGVQALLIDSALPEIEEEANRLLSRMTAGRMTLHLSTQRPTRTGEQETLDIQISDELGTRGYELFSGGEAFRIDFALRVALAKLLAHRAGAPMPTLIIDEGFGSQDASGRERLLEAITAIKNDFQRVLVVTHIDELRDAFPVRIEVTKTPQGSSVTVI